MIDIESLLDKAQALKGRENGIRWELAEIADKIVGSPLGRAGATKQLAQVCGLSAVDAVEHWAKAWRLYRVLYWYFGKAADMYRESFSVSHFYALWDLGHKHKMTIREIERYLTTLWNYKNFGGRWSVDVLREEINADCSNGKAVNWKKWHWPRLLGIAEKLVTFDGELDEYPEVKNAIKTIVLWKERIK